MIKPVLKDITVEVTNRCQLQCLSCGIWCESDRQEIAAPRFVRMMEKLLTGYQIRFVSLTGGEPLLHPSIGSIVRFLSLLRARGRITGFGLYSNGASPLHMERLFRMEGVDLRGIEVGISVDGDEKIHDVLRGQGAYRKTLKTLGFLAGECRDIVNLELKFTINRRNYRYLGSVYQLARTLGAHFSPKIMEGGVSSYYHRHEAPKASTLASLTTPMRSVVCGQIYDILAHGGQGVDKNMVKMLMRLLEAGPQAIRACATPRHSLFITSNGDMYPCLYMPSAGRVGPDGSIPTGWEVKKQELWRVAKAGHCPRCLAYHGFLKSFNRPYLSK